MAADTFLVELRTDPHWATVRGRVWLLVPRFVFVLLPLVFFALGFLMGRA